MRETEITVHVNRGNANTLETDTGSLETHRKISVVFRGHDRPAHVHLRLGGDLDRAVSIGNPNYYLEPDGVTVVSIDVEADHLEAPVDGELEVVTGYGSESLSIDVTIVPPPPEVDIDESLAQPTRSAPEPSLTERAASAIGFGTSTAGVLVLGIVALGIATLTAATVGGFVALLGFAIVVAGVVVALWLLLA
ncbi:DUF7524 family protein [Natrarchaeobius chitinivorans]|uniref:Uncharacterized protein n=1 Tax=Natrarchaeobius chitinivorans TaxID=1679083 RepID=A0A3N6N379_NATCH|nr:hypothetical protein [Natrarchaeobius chitinivorans]RQG92542.1 hypothetical protein EA473_16135 [Natrarchaeobius chitinivorans]